MPHIRGDGGADAGTPKSVVALLHVVRCAFRVVQPLRFSVPRLYLDNAATSFPKAPGVIDAFSDYATRLGASPGRGFYAESREGARLLSRTRSLLARLINAEDANHIVFALNTSDALNLAIKGIVRHRRLTQPKRPIHLITTALDHNSVLRPFRALEADAAAGIGPPVAVSILDGRPGTGFVSPALVEASIGPDTALVAINHASNVAGTIQPIAEIGAICRSHGVPFLVDGAQSMGHVPIDVRAMSIDLLAFPGHKGLLGPQGTGGLYIRPAIAPLLATTREGGTGHLSELDTQPEDMPQKLEAGSHNTAGIAGLGAAVEWILNRGIEAMRSHEIELSRAFVGALRANGANLLDAGPEVAAATESPDHRNDTSARAPLRSLTLLGPADPAARVAVFAFTHDTLSPAEFAAILESEFGILARSGLTCAPHAHTHFGTHPDQSGAGAFRLSFGAFNTLADVDRAVEALVTICSDADPIRGSDVIASVKTPDRTRSAQRSSRITEG